MATAFELKQEIVKYSHLLHARGWVANHDGNVSARLPRNAGFLITPTAISKRDAKPDGIAAVTPAGEPTGKQKPPSEVALHVGAYLARPEIGAVLHAHPPEASAFALAGRAIAPIAMPEVVVSLGASIPLVPLFLPKDPQATAAVQAALQGADVALLAGNGVIAVGADLEQAYLRLELIEHYARILGRALSLGAPPAALSGEALETLVSMRKKAGFVVPKGESGLRAVVADEVRRALGRKS
ncbi:MAG: class II aldolase/adducin family protein [Myxococcota bacterium]